MATEITADGVSKVQTGVINQDNLESGLSLIDSDDNAIVMPIGTTAGRPVSPTTGFTRFNSDTGSLEFYDGSGWISTNLIPTVDSVTGTIYAGAASNLTVSVSNATDTVTVRFGEGGSVVADVTDVDMSTGSASVAVPAAVYGQTAGDTIAVSVINSDGTLSSNAITKTVLGVPSGGTISNSGSYRIHTFTSSSSFVVPSNVSLSSVEYIVVAGGGGGGADDGGGGGAGGYRSSVSGEASGGGSSAETPLSLSAGSYTVTIGSGGSGGEHTVGGSISNGGNSVFHTITSIGGGAGGTSVEDKRLGSSGGSGGGNHQSLNAGGNGASGTSGQGYYGGGGDDGNSVFAGGGGGAGEPGNTDGIGHGGDGVQTSITGAATYFAGGGGGGIRVGSSDPPGGLGGGGSGTYIKDPGAQTAGQANTGGGGGGGPGTGSNGNREGKNGGSGIVIVRYQL